MWVAALGGFAGEVVLQSFHNWPGDTDVYSFLCSVVTRKRLPVVVPNKYIYDFSWSASLS